MEDKKTFNTDEFETPQWLFNELDAIFHFKLDACASVANSKCELHIDAEQNALVVDWFKLLNRTFEGTPTDPSQFTVFMNPPYNKGKLVLQLMEKVVEEYNKGLDIVTLTDAKTDTKFMRIIWENAWKVIFFYGRFKFEMEGKPIIIDGKEQTGRNSSVLAIFSHKYYDLSSLKTYGKIITPDKELA